MNKFYALILLWMDSFCKGNISSDYKIILQLSENLSGHYAIYGRNTHLKNHKIKRSDDYYWRRYYFFEKDPAQRDKTKSEGE